jgi:acetyl esterase/lipase
VVCQTAFAAAEDAADLRINLVDRSDLIGLPAATVITAQNGPLRSENIAYGKALQAAGVAVGMRSYEAVTHEFFGMRTVVPQALEAINMRRPNYSPPSATDCQEHKVEKRSPSRPMEPKRRDAVGCVTS